MKFWTPLAIRTMLSNLKASVTGGNFSGLLVGTYVGQYKGISGSPNGDRVMGDLTEADYVGYARVALGTLVGPYEDEAALEVLLSAALSFHSTNSATPNTVLGYFLVDAATAGNLLGLDPLDNPQSFGDAFAGKEYVARIALPKTLQGAPGVIAS